jgi:3-hydroxyisobutyrate dehydrogenase-like beta-hydroxyacid dehydrogenase
LRSFGAEVADSVGQTYGCDGVITILADDTALENVGFESQEFFSSFAANSVHVSASTISMSMAKRLAKTHAEQGGQFLAAPIMGRPEMAASRQISLLAGGGRSTYKQCLAVLESVSQNVRLVCDEPWQANLLKLCENFLLLSAVETLAEIFALLPTGGVAPSVFLEVMNQTLLNMPFDQSYGPRMISGEFLPSGFQRLHEQFAATRDSSRARNQTTNKRCPSNSTRVCCEPRLQRSRYRSTRFDNTTGLRGSFEIGVRRFGSPEWITGNSEIEYQLATTGQCAFPAPHCLETRLSDLSSNESRSFRDGRLGTNPLELAVG